MPFVVTVDQRKSRSGPARAATFARHLNSKVKVLRQFELTVGDELQGVLDSPEALVGAIREIVRDGRWWTGIGVGATKLKQSTRTSAGPAFVAAREAVEQAKKLPWGLSVVGATPASNELQQAFALWITLLADRSKLGWQTVELRRAGHTEIEIARRLRISQQAVNQRLRAARYAEDEEGSKLILSIAGRALRGRASR